MRTEEPITLATWSGNIVYNGIEPRTGVVDQVNNFSVLVQGSLPAQRLQLALKIGEAELVSIS